MIPKFLKKYEDGLIKYQKEAVSIEAIGIETPALKDALGIKTSKFLGLPFFPKSKIYPKDKNGKPMLLTAQLNFNEIPKLQGFPDSGILQLFLSGTDWYDEDSKIIYHSELELNNEYIEDFSFLSAQDFGEMPILKVHELKFEKKIENGGLEDCQFDFLFGGEDWFDFIEKLNEEEEKEFNDFFDASGHKLGGYADFTQSDPRDYRGRNVDDVQLLQIDSSDDIIFGDVGLGHVFIDIKSLKERRFDKAYFTWDCC